MSRSGETFETAIDNMILKRTPDSISVLMDCLEAGLRKGEITANDIRDKEWTEPNVLGGTMRACLPACGFRIDRSRPHIKAIAKKKNGRMLPVWVLDEPVKAGHAIAKLKRITFDLIGAEEKGETQGQLF